MRTVLGRLLPPQRPDTDLGSWLDKIAALSNDNQLREGAEHLAKRMVSWVNTKNVTTWRSAAAKAQKSRLLHALLSTEMRGATGSRISQLVRENSSYIKSIPTDAAEILSREIHRAQENGARPETIARLAQRRWPELIKSRINLISRTESQKTSTALTRARCEDLGIEFYIWMTAQDGDRVRRSHRLMDGVVVPWGAPPAPEALAGERSTLGRYHAGECPNCRCTQRVIFTMNDLHFPVRVAWQGAIVRMSQKQFRAIAPNLEYRAA